MRAARVQIHSDGSLVDADLSSPKHATIVAFISVPPTTSTVTRGIRVPVIEG